MGRSLESAVLHVVWKSTGCRCEQAQRSLSYIIFKRHEGHGDQSKSF